MKRFNNDSNILDRKSTRLIGYDYSQPGPYFVTICTHEMKKLFGRIIGGVLDLNPYGCTAKKEWFQITVNLPYVELHEDEFVIMPNHIHGIIWITEVGATEPVAQNSRSGLNPRSLGAIVGQYKSRTAKLINRNRNTPGKKVWQRNYYDRVIRNEKELQSIRIYIINNPLQWEDDQAGSIHNII
jgi:REP element-mobilizing transposase RayT